MHITNGVETARPLVALHSVVGEIIHSFLLRANLPVIRNLLHVLNVWRAVWLLFVGRAIVTALAFLAVLGRGGGLCCRLLSKVLARSFTSLLAFSNVFAAKTKLCVRQ
jgi:hypothetical protein